MSLGLAVALILWLVALITTPAVSATSYFNCSAVESVLSPRGVRALHFFTDTNSFHPLEALRELDDIQAVKLLQDLLHSNADTTSLCNLMSDTENGRHHCAECLTGADSEGSDFASPLAALRNLTSFVNTVHFNLIRIRPLEIPRSQTLVVGAGPLGLLNAIIAFAAGSEVVIVEKRTNYTRTTWFDLGPDSYYPSIPWLRKLGFEFLPIEHIQTLLSTGEQIVTIRAGVFERFLAKVVTLLDIPIRYGYAFVQLCSSNLAGLRLSTLPEADFDCGSPQVFDEILPFDLLIGADGASSRVRKESGLSFDSVLEFTGPDGEKIQRKEPLRQPSVIVNFKSRPEGSCPPLRDSEQNTDSVAVSMRVEGVTSVFKRFYKGHCHLQILLHSSKRSAISSLLEVQEAIREARKSPGWSDAQMAGCGMVRRHTAAIPLDLLRDVAKVLFDLPIKTYQDVVELIDTTPAGLLAVTAAPVEIQRASAVVKSVKVIPSSWNTGLILLVGDAKVSAHYRLGVGVNFGFKSLELTRSLVQNLSRLRHLPAEEFDRELNAFSKRGTELQSLQVEGQVRTVYFEAFCDLVVAFDLKAPDLVAGQLVYEKLYDNYLTNQKDYLQILSPLEILAHCHGA